MKTRKQTYKLWVLAFLFIALALPFISADLGTVKQGDCINIRVLANCSAVNITEVTNGLNEYIINDVMTNLGGQTFNYTFCNTSTLGTYDYSWNNICVDCSQGDCENSFEVTATGADKISSGESTILIIMIISLLALSLFFFVLGMKIVNPITSIGLVIASGITLFILVLTTMDFIIENLSQLGTIVETYRTVLVIVKWMVSLGITSLVLYTGWRALQLFRIKRGLAD